MDGAATRSTERAARDAATRPAAAWNIMECAATSMCVGIGRDKHMWCPRAFGHRRGETADVLLIMKKLLGPQAFEKEHSVFLRKNQRHARSGHTLQLCKHTPHSGAQRVWYSSIPLPLTSIIPADSIPYMGPEPEATQVNTSTSLRARLFSVSQFSLLPELAVCCASSRTLIHTSKSTPSASRCTQR